ncbi:D-2-hydroxyacid dehydrogenase [Falsibacillus albus]|uniref:D-2-hydroxyacid dehydrogenase n=1 Tax=Falsibacillus albus TaxID=2478915 RepID=A0A3L7JNT5_9BACI|nr:D-2-hydroxyacid dehydrogenase [Falsibacillus albus]RLQ92356.1 D-2-hydroxyacid dehydrogenase [Falsibacillus albus]
MKILFTFDPLKEYLEEVEQLKGQPMESMIETNINRVSDRQWNEVEALVTFGEDLKEIHIQKAKHLKWIMVVSAGLELMPLEAIQKRDILVTNARGIHKIPMAEFTVGLMLEHAKQFRVLLGHQENHSWHAGHSMNELHGKNVMIVGAGAIGTEIAKVLSVFGMNVHGVNSSGTVKKPFHSMHTLNTFKDALPEVDFVINLLPSTNWTRFIFTKDHFTRMKPSAVFINIGRGDAVKEDVLLDVLKNKIIAFAFLDVFMMEPLPSNHPFWFLDNLVITPHVSSHSENYLRRAFEIFRHNLHTYINNKNTFTNIIDPKRGY